MQTSIIIYAFNNDKTIFQVVASCCKHNPNSEVIIVDDGSIDETDSLMEALSVHHTFCYLKLTEFKGLGYAIAKGVECSEGEMILLINASCQNIRKEEFEDVLQPLGNSECRMVVTRYSDTDLKYDISPFQSLIRIRGLLKEDLKRIIPDLREMKYNINLFIDLFFQLKGKRVKTRLVTSYELEEKIVLPKSGKTREINDVKKVVLSELYLSDIELIIKRLKNHLGKDNHYTWCTISSVQRELNKKISLVLEP